MLLHHRLLILFTASLLAACSRPETSSTPTETSAAEPEKNLVTLTPQSLEHVTIKTESVRPDRLKTTLKVAGRVTENLNQTARVCPTLEGRIAKLAVDLNDRVKAGDVLALVQAPELLGRPLEVKAPIDGVITTRHGAVGELVEKGAPLYTISDPANLWVIAEIKERDIAAVQPGQEATFRVLPYPGRAFSARVDRLGNQVEGDTRTLETRLLAENEDGALKPGLFADIEIATGQLDETLVLPASAVQSEGGERFVFVALDAHRFEKRPVQTGVEWRGRVQILDGLRAGENVVTDGGFVLRSELAKGELGEE